MSDVQAQGPLIPTSPCEIRFPARMTPDDPLDVVVVGGGAAGLYSALTAADSGSRVAMVSRKPLSESSSFWAQGGLAAAIGPDDSPEQHAEDTLAAGRGACRPSAAELLAAEAPGAGADLADLGLCQFHPPARGAPGSSHDGLLVTEAVRGEGATLLGANGERFTDELAPRDEVTLAVLDRMRRDGTDHVLLDMRELSETRFPSVFEALRDAGHDPAKEPIPVSPASHYVMGGIATDLEGRSTLPGLFAVGECACTGLHGANRLASNSLTECFLLGARAAAGDA